MTDFDFDSTTELVNGRPEPLDPATRTHQRAVIRMLDALSGADGELVLGPFPLRLSADTYRLPDVVFVRAENLHRMQDAYSEVADLVVEVVSRDRSRDLVEKRVDYAAAGVAEYWIVDPAEARVTVLRLDDGAYIEHGSWGPGGTATSAVLSQLRVDVARLFA